MFHFFAMLSRMKYINRWGLMRSVCKENISEHSLDVAVIAHALAVIRNTRYGGNVNAERAAVLAIFHDATEIMTGDLPTPVKYYNPEIRSAYRAVECVAQKKLVSMLPEDLKPNYESLIFQNSPQDAELLPFIKAADKISALIKCLEEKRMGNTEYAQAELTLTRAIQEMNLPEADCFMRDFLPSYNLTLDEQD